MIEVAAAQANAAICKIPGLGRIPKAHANPVRGDQLGKLHGIRFSADQLGA